MKSSLAFQPCRHGRDRRTAFTLVELLLVVIILGILAAVVIPQISDASSSARETMLRENLRMMRQQIGCYRVQHRDTPPGYPDGDRSAEPCPDTFAAQMTSYTDSRGAVNPVKTERFTLGPYLSRMPENPFNRRSDVLMLDFDEDVPADPGTGWVFRPELDQFLAGCPGLDSRGIAFVDY